MILVRKCRKLRVRLAAQAAFEREARRRMLDRKKLTIVVVEDDAGMRKALERLLRAAGFSSVLFSSAEELLGSDAANSAACLVLDVHLPGLSGFELRRRLAASGRDQPVIFITAVDDEFARDEARRLACSGYFRKPFEGVALLRTIEGALSARLSE